MGRWTEWAREYEQRVAAAALRRGRERPALVSILLHGLFETEAEARGGAVNPYQAFLVADLERLVEHFLEHGYRFVSPRQLLVGLDPGRKHVLLTFDDGYANNLRAIPVLRQFDVPATFFVTTAPIVERTAFWWDALYRERHQRGASDRAIDKETRAVMRRPHESIHTYMIRRFGRRALSPLGETDRPMTEAELKLLAGEPLATVGNHTVNHALLTTYPEGAVKAQIQGAQDYLESVIGSAPQIIAYPSGAYNRRVVRIARALGLRLGAIVRPTKNRLPLTRRRTMTIARYFLHGGPSLIAECQVCRSDRQVMRPFKRLRAALS